MNTIEHSGLTQLRDLEREPNAERSRPEPSMAATAAADGVDEDADGAPSMPRGDDDVAERRLRLRVRERHQAMCGALRRVAEGAFGLLHRLPRGDSVPGRLPVMPESERCVACGSTA